MKHLVLLLAVSVIFATQSTAFAQTPAPNQPDVLKFITQFVDGFNKGDSKALIASCAAQSSIIDEFPPYEWHGAGACAKWLADYDTDAKKNGITDGIVTLGKPTHTDISGDRAYVVIPSDYSFKVKGKPEKEVGSMFTFALQKSAAGWHLTGWSWSKH
jgi:hypothetical protein